MIHIKCVPRDLWSYRDYIRMHHLTLFSRIRTCSEEWFRYYKVGRRRGQVQASATPLIEGHSQVNFKRMELPPSKVRHTIIGQPHSSVVVWLKYLLKQRCFSLHIFDGHEVNEQAETGKATFPRQRSRYIHHRYFLPRARPSCQMFHSMRVYLGRAIVAHT